MKRILTLLCALALVVALAVPAFADTYTATIPSFDSVWTDKEAYPYAVMYQLGGTSDIMLYVSEYVTYYSGGYVHVRKPYERYQYYASLGEWRVSVTNPSSNTQFSADNLVLWTNHDIMQNDTVKYPAGEIVFPSCDGTSCSAIDVNVDGLCDECGLRLMSLSASPVAPDVDVPNKGWVTTYDGTEYKYTVFSSESSYTIRGSIYGSSYRVDTTPAVTVTQYTSYDGRNWEQTDTRTVNSYYPALSSAELLSSSFDWFTESGEHFFPVPLWAEMDRVTQGEMMGLTAETLGTMKVLVACGVGLMALLVLLALFGKRSLLYRG